MKQVKMNVERILENENNLSHEKNAKTRIINQINPSLGWTVTKVVEKDPSKNWFKLPGKPVGKWEIELYRKQTAWDSDSNLRVPKAHELWQSAPSLAHIYTHFTIISSNRSRLLRLLLCSCCVHRVEHDSAQKRRLGLFNRHLATDLRQSKSNYDFCENCSSLDKWRLLKIGLVRYPCQKEVSEFQGISSQSDPSRPEAIYFRVTAWLDNFSSVSSSQHILKPFTSWKKKHLINRSTKMQCLNWRLGFSGALQPPSDSSIFLRGTIMPQNSGNFYERSNQYWRPISWLQWR